MTEGIRDLSPQKPYNAANGQFVSLPFPEQARLLELRSTTEFSSLHARHSDVYVTVAVLVATTVNSLAAKRLYRLDWGQIQSRFPLKTLNADLYQSV